MEESEKRIKSIKYRIYPNKEQEKLLKKYFAGVRYVYNRGLAFRKLLYKARGESISAMQMCRYLTRAKKTERHKWLSDIPADSLDESLRNLDKAYKNFFRKLKIVNDPEEAGFPKFKSVYRDQAVYLRVSRGGNPNIKLRVLDGNKFGKVWINRALGEIKISVHTEGAFPEGQMLAGGSISKNRIGQYFLSLSFRQDAETVISGEDCIGIDMGVKRFVATSRGEFYDFPKEISRLSNLCKRDQNRMAKKKKGGQNRTKAKLRLAKRSKRVAEMREYFHYQVASEIVSDQSIGTIKVEDLNIKNMTKSAKGDAENPGKNVKAKSGLNREILARGWGGFLAILERKAEERGIKFVRVPAAYTSRTCSACGYESKENRKTQELFKCVSCGHEENADINAAKNIAAS